MVCNPHMQNHAFHPLKLPNKLQTANSPHQGTGGLEDWRTGGLDDWRTGKLLEQKPGGRSIYKLQTPLRALGLRSPGGGLGLSGLGSWGPGGRI